MNHQPCYCGSKIVFAKCCEPVILEETPASTAETLMRSRYSAFVVQDSDWLLKSWHPSTRPPEITFDKQQKWIGLKILSKRHGGPDDDEGEVEFVARFKINGKAHRLHERSRFTRIKGQWVYVDGVIIES